MSKNIVLFGATGSIGTSVLNVFEKTNSEFCLKGITCDQNITSLIDISNRYSCDKLGVAREGLLNQLKDKFGKDLDKSMLNEEIILDEEE